MHARAVLYHLLWAIHLEPFDYLVHGSGLVTTIVLVALVESNNATYSWYIVFTPLLGASLISAYFQAIIFFRLRAEGDSRQALRKGVWVLLFCCFLATFEVLMPVHLQTNRVTLAQALSPAIVLLTAVLFRFLGAVFGGYNQG